MIRILVADKIAEAGLAALKAQPGVSFDTREGLAPAELARIVGEYDGMLVRSAVEVTAEVLARPGKLAAIARAGVGVDNIDLEAATRAGVLVLNTPDANTISTAEHTIAMMLAMVRRIPDAHAHVRGGQWKRGQFMGDQVAGKTLGIVGLGRIGRAVARRALGLEMKVLAYDPFVAGETALEGAVRLVPSLDALLPECDCVTLHASLSADSRALLGAEQFARMKKGARIVNCARGALIDEPALSAALTSGHVAAAAIDVYENEPPVGSPLLTAPNIVLTPHLAASTQEAQTAVSVEAVEVLLAYLMRGEIRSAVNVHSLPAHLSPRERAMVDLMGRMGRVLSPWCEHGLKAVRVSMHGDGFAKLGETLARQAVVGLLDPHLDVRVNLVNAQEQARQRGIRLEHAVHAPRQDRADSVVLLIETQAQPRSIEGTVYPEIGPRVLAIDGYRMEIVPEKHLVLIFNDDRPGVIGLVGQLLGEAGVNIADMTLSRRGQTALMLLKLDAPLGADLRARLEARRPPILSVSTVNLPGIGT